MDKSKQDKATLDALIHKLNTRQIPRARRMLERLENGEKLRDEDIDILKLEYDEYMKDWGIVERNPQYTEIATGYVELYTKIIEMALQNEKAR